MESFSRIDRDLLPQILSHYPLLSRATSNQYINTCQQQYHNHLKNLILKLIRKHNIDYVKYIMLMLFLFGEIYIEFTLAHLLHYDTLIKLKTLVPIIKDADDHNIIKLPLPNERVLDVAARESEKYNYEDNCQIKIMYINHRFFITVGFSGAYENIYNHEITHDEVSAFVDFLVLHHFNIWFKDTMIYGEQELSSDDLDMDMPMRWIDKSAIRKLLKENC